MAGIEKGIPCPLERFFGRLNRSRQIVGEELRRAKTPGDLRNALKQISVYDRTSGWMPRPLPGSAGNGIIGQGTRNMSRGRLP